MVGSPGVPIFVVNTVICLLPSNVFWQKNQFPMYAYRQGPKQPVQQWSVLPDPFTTDTIFTLNIVGMLGKHFSRQHFFLFFPEKKN